MVKKTRLEELSGELPDKEREELLNKISRTGKQEDREEIIPVTLKKDERERLVSEEMLRISWFFKVLLWLKGLLTGKSKRELFLKMQLNRVKYHIRQRNPGLTGFETRNLTPKFANYLYDLYIASYPLLDFFKSFNLEPEFRNNSIISLVEANLIPLEKLEEIYEKSGSEGELKKEVLRKFNEYIKQIPEKLFGQLEEGIKPLLFLKNIVLFSYSSMFTHFNYNLSGKPSEKHPYFHHAPAMLLLDKLEKLYYSVFLATQLGKKWLLHEELVRFYGTGKLELEDNSEELEQRATDLTRSVIALESAIHKFQAKVPLMELIRYFRRDPYYRLIFNVPKLYLKAIYTASIKNRFLEQLDEHKQAIKERVADKKIDELFKGSKLLELYYYVPKQSVEERERGIPFFSHCKSLKILYNYLVRKYKGTIQECVQLSSAYVLSTNRLIQNRLMQCAASLEELEAKIVLFDRSLSPDEDDGKTMMHFKHGRSLDVNEQKLYRSFISQKDREAFELIERGKECLLGIKNIFNDIITSPMESVKSILKTIHFQRGRNETLLQILKRNAELIEEYYNFMDQLIALEKGT
jgi:hypothetical protein